MSKSSEQLEQDRREARAEYLARPKHYAETFLEKYSYELEGVAMVDVLKTFYVYVGCASQFSVTDYIRKLKGKK